MYNICIITYIRYNSLVINNTLFNIIISWQREIKMCAYRTDVIYFFKSRIKSKIYLYKLISLRLHNSLPRYLQHIFWSIASFIMYRNHVLAAVVLYDTIALNNLYKFIIHVWQYVTFIWRRNIKRLLFVYVNVLYIEKCLQLL